MSRVVRKETLNKYKSLGWILDLKILKSLFSINQAVVELSIKLHIKSR